MVSVMSDPVESLDDPSLYIDRELSLLEFQRRVLEEAQERSNPLLERLNFLSILFSNLDEFFMVRVAVLKQTHAANASADGAVDGQLDEIRATVRQLLAEANREWRQIRSDLERAGILVDDLAALAPDQRFDLDRYFHQVVFPVLTPLALDPGRPFPHISNLSLNLAVLIQDEQGNQHFARIKVPDSLPQLVPLKKVSKKLGKAAPRRIDLVWLEQVVAAHLTTLFPGMQVLEAHPFHVTRDADISIKELEAEDLLETIEEGVRQRRFGSVVRLMVTQDMPRPILEILMKNLEVGRSEVYRSRRPLSLKRLASLSGLDRPDLKYPPFVPASSPALTTTDEDDIFTLIRR